MVIETAILKHLLNTSAVTVLVGRRIYYVIAPQNVVKPYIVFSKISAVRVSSHDGPSHLANPRFQFSCFGETYKSMKDMALALQGALEGYTGTLGGAGGVPVNGVFYENETDLDDNVAVDYKFWHEE
ncbi:MAG: DUF3168 domain-containing protein [Candidatus Omnitrophota bacterium]|jgi:hypothetical protein